MSTDSSRAVAAQARAALAKIPKAPWEVWLDHNAEAHVSQQGRRGFALIADPGRGWPDYGLAIAEFLAAAPDLIRSLAEEVDRLTATAAEDEGDATT